MNRKLYQFIVILIIMTLFNMACSTFGIRSAKEPSYEVVKQDGDIEIRKYRSYIVAKTYFKGNYDDTSDESFRRLAAYIFGDNKSRKKMDMTSPVIQERSNEKIEMTAPVIQEKEQEGWVMSFVMPQKYTLDSLPKPMSDLISFEEIPSKTVAVLKYSGLTSEKKINELSGRLMNWLNSNGYAIASDIRSARYDPPWTLPFLRRNEIHADAEDEKK